MMPPGTRSASLARCSPTRRFSASDSRTQGPAMRKSASEGKRAISSSVRGLDEGPLLRLAFPTPSRIRRGGDESREKRMWPRGARLELGVELAADEPGVVLELNDLDELPVRREAAQPHPVLHEEVAIAIRDLVTMPVPLAHLGHAVDLGGARATSEPTRVGAEPHRAAHVRHVLLRLHEGDHGVVAFRGELGRVAVLQLADVARELDDGCLHAEADAEEREARLARGA